MENAPEANPGKYPQTPSIEVGQGVSMGDIVSHGPFIFMNIVGSTFIFNIFLCPSSLASPGTGGLGSGGFPQHPDPSAQINTYITGNCKGKF